MQAGSGGEAGGVHVAVVIPCFDVERHIREVVAGLPPEVRTIVAVDDCSRDGTRAVLESLEDPRLVRVYRDRNGGVGAAMRSGYEVALGRGADVCVKMDGDGQMAGADVPRLIAPLLAGRADYAKGNRFGDLAALRRMPAVRMLGNGVLSFVNKLVSGYWSILDPTNGFAAIRSDVLRVLNVERLHPRYFFETSLLIELNIAGARVADVDIPARYGEERSHLSVVRSAFQFPLLQLRGLLRRFLWRYVLRDFNVLTLCVLAGVPAMLFGLAFGGYHWWQSVATGTPATAGTTLLAALPIILGFQCLLVALVLDILYEPRRPLHLRLRRERTALAAPPAAQLSIPSSLRK